VLLQPDGGVSEFLQSTVQLCSQFFRRRKVRGSLFADDRDLHRNGNRGFGSSGGVQRLSGHVFLFQLGCGGILGFQRTRLRQQRRSREVASVFRIGKWLFAGLES
jgi:hypothetical protein